MRSRNKRIVTVLGGQSTTELASKLLRPIPTGERPVPHEHARLTAIRLGTRYAPSAGGFTGWGAIVVVVGLNTMPRGLCPYDASAFSGFRFQVKGNGNLRVNVGIQGTTAVADGGLCASSTCSDYGITNRVARRLEGSHAAVRRPDPAKLGVASGVEPRRDSTTHFLGPTR